VHFVKDRAGERVIKRLITLPVIRFEVRHDTLRGGTGVVTRFHGRTTLIVFRRNRPGIRIEKEFLRVETVPEVGSVWPPHPVAVQLARLNPRKVNMPVVRSAVYPGKEVDDAGWLSGIFGVEEE
jgi:hypothetical protein